MIRSLMFPAAFVALAAFVSGTAAAQPLEVAAGEDLGAWISLEQRRLEGPDRVAAYRAYVLAWASSPLATVAWDRLVDLGADLPWSEDPVTLAAITSVKERWIAQRGALSRRPAPAAVASIDLSAPTR